MPTINLSKIVETVSLRDLHLLAAMKRKLDALRQRRAVICRELGTLDKKIDAMQTSLPPVLSDRSNLAKIRRAMKRARKERRPRQPTIETLMGEIMREKKRPLSVRELTDAVLEEKGYKTTSPNFRNQLRVLLYRNQKGLYQRVGTGRFTLAASRARAETGGTQRTTAATPEKGPRGRGRM